MSLPETTIGIRGRRRKSNNGAGGARRSFAWARSTSGRPEVEGRTLPIGAPSVADAWPRTRRPLPWLIAAFLATIFLVPIEAIHMKVSLPFSSDFDRFFVAIIVATWVVGGSTGGAEGVMRLRSRGWAAGMIAFALVAVASIAVNVGRITNLGEWDVAEKRFAVLVGLVALFAIFTLTLRVAELRPFAILIVVLAVITATGTICEKKTGYNVFYATATAVFSPVATVDPAPTEINPDPNEEARRWSRGRPDTHFPIRRSLAWPFPSRWCLRQ